MKEKDLTRAERYALLLYRQNKPKTERSTAMPRQFYADPAASILFERERQERQDARARRLGLREKETD